MIFQFDLFFRKGESFILALFVFSVLSHGDKSRAGLVIPA